MCFGGFGGASGRTRAFAVAASLLLFLATGTICRAAGGVRLTVATRTGVHVFAVEEAVTKAERERGLMFRTDLPADGGMLFVFPTEKPVTFWMENTALPLDMLFVRADGTIAGVVVNAKPMSQDLIPSPEPVRFVLELNGGTAGKIGAKAGDTVSSRLIRSSPD